jgi:hypothetical protein
MFACQIRPLAEQAGIASLALTEKFWAVALERGNYQVRRIVSMAVCLSTVPPVATMPKGDNNCYRDDNSCHELRIIGRAVLMKDA